MRSGPGEARTILLLHIISVRPSKHPLMVRTFLKVYMELGSYFLFLQEQIKDIIIISASKGNMERFSNSRGVVKTNLEKKLVAVVGVLIQIVNKIVSQS
jgi:GTPase involved in cell partitioning and DNA repair